MKLGGENATRTLLARITHHEPIREDQFAARLRVGSEGIASSLADGRLFFFLGPDEVKYYPAFYGDTTLHLGALEQVCRKLSNLESASKYHFFTSRSTFLLTKTPLEDLRDWLLTKMLMAAVATRAPNAQVPYCVRLADIGVPIVAWRIITKPHVNNEAIESEIESLDCLGVSGRARYLGIVSPDGYMAFFDGREYYNWDDFEAEENGK